MYLALQCSELRLHIKRVSYIHFVVCLQIHPRAGNKMNEKCEANNIRSKSSAAIPAVSNSFCFFNFTRKILRMISSRRTLLGRGFFPSLKRRKRNLCTDLLEILSRMRERRLKFCQRIRVDGS